MYSTGLNIFAAVKMVKAYPDEERVATAEISKDHITIVPLNPIWGRNSTSKCDSTKPEYPLPFFVNVG